MPAVIWKYEIPSEKEFSLEMPMGARILSVQVQNGKPCLWALVDKEHAKSLERFKLVGTGHDMQVDVASIEMYYEFAGTFLLDRLGLVFHLFKERRT